jgi:hypothetical protein
MTLYTLPIPANLNGDQLQEEVKAAAVYVIEDKLVIDSDKTEEQVKAIVAAHIPIPPTQPTIAEKLASVGLSIEELKAALGGN